MSFYQKLLKYKVVPILYFLIFITIIAIGIYWFIHSGLVPLLGNSAALEAYFEGMGAKGYLVVFLLQTFGTVFLPATGGMIAVASSMIFGFTKTFFICSAATILGSCVSFSLARYLGRPLVDLFLDKHKVDKYIDSFEERKHLLLFLMFFFPFFPDGILCYVAGLVSIRWRSFLIAAALGRPWGLILSCLLGTSVFTLPTWTYFPLIVFIVTAFLLSWKYGPKLEELIIAKVNQKKEQRAAKGGIRAFNKRILRNEMLSAKGRLVLMRRPSTNKVQ